MNKIYGKENNLYKHGFSSTRFYNIYRGLKRRCNEVNHIEYHRYGAKGIKCLWNSFEEFKRDMYESYRDKLTIDRIDNARHYCKENCRWSTATEQGRNKRNNHLLTFKDKTACLSEWSEITKIKAPTIRYRLKKGWSAEEALTNPLMVNQFR